MMWEVHLGARGFQAPHAVVPGILPLVSARDVLSQLCVCLRLEDAVMLVVCTEARPRLSGEFYPYLRGGVQRPKTKFVNLNRPPILGPFDKLRLIEIEIDKLENFSDVGG